MMLVVVDTDIINKLSRRSDINELINCLRKYCMQITVPETVVKEVIVTSDPNVRALLADTLIDLLGDCLPLASVPYQIKWGVKRFLEGEVVFKPFRCFQPDKIKMMLKNAKSLRNNQLEPIRIELADGSNRWDIMHNCGRPKMQEVLRKSGGIPDAGDWIKSIRDSEFIHEIVIGIISEPNERNRLKPQVADYIEWNTVCRCFLEQMMLSIRRHGLEHQSSMSKKGPKWADYFINAFVGITDLFVTDDTRLRRALRQHRSLKTPANWKLCSFTEFIDGLQNNLLLNHVPEHTSETWQAFRG
jgi:rRNA-processing protein FCF1